MKKIDSLNKFSISEFIYNWKYSNYNKKFIKHTFWEEEDIKWLFFNLLKKWWEFYEKFRVHVSDYEPSIEKIWQLAKSSNAILSIAHPNFTFKSWIEDFKNEISYYVDREINAIEINPFADKKWIETILELKKKYDLILTFGSDCHKLWWIDDKHHDFWTMNTFISDEIINENFKKFREKIGV